MGLAWDVTVAGFATDLSCWKRVNDKGIFWVPGYVTFHQPHLFQPFRDFFCHPADAKDPPSRAWKQKCWRSDLDFSCRIKIISGNKNENMASFLEEHSILQNFPRGKQKRQVSWSKIGGFFFQAANVGFLEGRFCRNTQGREVGLVGFFPIKKK